MHGWIGTILRVNLTDRTVKEEPLDPKLARQFIGARGLGTKILYDEIDPRTDPLGPDNKLLFAPGPFSGTYAPSAGRYDVIAKSPLTGAIAASNSGGSFGPELRYAGYDLLILEGKADKPVYLYIRDKKVEIRDAGHLWGQSVPDTTDRIRAETDDDAKVACIGPAGERLSLIANVLNEMHRAAGRGGVGAVMGSKNLKAIAVLGGGAVEVADPQGFRDSVMQARQKIQAHPVGGGGLKAFGTDVLINILNQTGALPTRNFREGQFATADKVGGESLSAQILVRPKGCFSCIISCGRVTDVKDPKYQGAGEGPEYETAWALGPDCGVDNLAAITKANYLCNEFGLDTISMGSTIACAMDLYEAGFIGLKDTGGIPLTFGNADALVEMVRQTGLREGLGDKLAMGSYRLAESFGHPEFSMSAKKQEMPAYDPRGVQGIGLNYATSNRGGCHVRGYTIAAEILGIPVKVDNLTTEGKAQLDITFQNLTAALDSSGACLFSLFGIGADELARMLSSLTGITYTTEDFLKTGDRIWNLERLFNLRAGFTEKDDTLPERLLKEPLPGGPAKGKVSRLGEMLPEYYQLRGWDEHGVPTEEKLKELALA
ncbi:MAG TPA: aldehyde ferredoxin oxidoreductase family protein [Candidatus Methylomirabilis sp.]|nr:aldehyde ferredoxin oxidoreductase family protein [Candidatus Methylomirabilis sp.]